jgi:hypothetical protein
VEPTTAPAHLQAFRFDPFPPQAPEEIDWKREQGAHRILTALFGKAAGPPPAPEHVPDPARPYAEVEDLTWDFRHALADKHRDKSHASLREYHDALTVWDPFDGDMGPPTTTSVIADFGADCMTRATWHRNRAGGQTTRFARVRSCGSRIVIASCLTCGDARKARPEGCGVARVCPRCSLAGAKERRARFGKARGISLYRSMKIGLTRKHRAGGRYTEKMLTLTVPHVTLAECTDIVAKEARDDTHARIVALFRAWPIFLRFLNRAWKRRGEDGYVKYHRAFEWTPGKDAIGHPHFHVYMWCPFVPVELIRAWWAHALRVVGVPVKQDAEGLDVVVVRLQMVRDFNPAMIEELIKGGRRDALTLSRLELGPRGGGDVYDYADGWTIGDVMHYVGAPTVARLYMALEGRRLAQASRGFFIDDPPLECPKCGCPHYAVRFEPNEVWFPINPHERAPP